MTSSPLVRKLGFTGSTGVGKLSMRHCADQVKKVSLELGGNAPFIVFDDADLDIAVSAARVCKFRNSGQTCVSANRMLVQAWIYDAFVERLTADVAALRVADCLFEGVQVGPLIDEPPIGKVESHVAEDEAIPIVNRAPYGLAVTSDLARTWRVGDALECGIVGVNTGLISKEVAPFGGVEESGIGREGSSFAVDDWTELEYGAVGGLQPAGG
jgi:succinate-semialdehyde dehydrogenase/glutarate-semialdehyde dehydrogenase